MLCDSKSGKSHNQPETLSRDLPRMREHLCPNPDSFPLSCIRAIVYDGGCFGYGGEFASMLTGGVYDALFKGEDCATVKTTFRKSTVLSSWVIIGLDYSRTVTDR